MRLSVVIGLILVAVGAVFYTQFTLLVIQPIGAVPEGRTILIKRVGDLQFIDSADAFCDRHMGGVSLFCRGIALGKMAEASSVYARLPYSETLYLISTGGKTFDR